VVVSTPRMYFARGKSPKGAADVLDVVEEKMLRTEICLVDVRLLRANIVRPKGSEHALQAVGD